MTKKLYRVSVYLYPRQFEIEAENEEQAEDIIRSREFPNAFAEPIENVEVEELQAIQGNTRQSSAMTNKLYTVTLHETRQFTVQTATAEEAEDIVLADKSGEGDYELDEVVVTEQ